MTAGDIMHDIEKANKKTDKQTNDPPALSLPLFF